MHLSLLLSTLLHPTPYHIIPHPPSPTTHGEESVDLVDVVVALRDARGEVRLIGQLT